MSTMNRSQASRKGRYRMLSSIESEDNERIPTLKALTIGWRLTYIDAGDDSDDLIVELPDDLLRATAWAEGDLLEMEAEAEAAPSDEAHAVRRLQRQYVRYGHGLLQAH
ncbi:hypothetical protein SAMN05216194_105304 [Stutzerimonas kunmingensis]|uniref:hypothetical protein n=1 Tax=Stutzerimonas kunmingensis TaxID=1211807 RepID=UPI0008EE4FEB|nr:hypothetical protein [Stutzerimonas kunmingensis]MCQ2043455.1 hypothetical protein [Stutzerimonas kunmingensis]SFJ73099.1 hypothetical protein SAMN05216194_105304 [Stutzerimonas kunmingensis]